MANGYNVAGIASNRAQAIEGIDRRSPNVVIMDIVLMGHSDGVDAAKIVRDEFDIPVVYLTSHADPANPRTRHVHRTVRLHYQAV